MTTTITISAQHLDGNDPEGFDTAAWLDALETEYRNTATAYFPDAEIVVEIDRQKRNSGYTRPVEIYADSDEVDDVNQVIDAGDFLELKTAIEYVRNALYDARGQEFFR
jgi:hypothetical protein